VAENITSRVPAISRIVDSPAVGGVLQSLLGEGYALHPHTFLHSTNPGQDQVRQQRKKHMTQQISSSDVSWRGHKDFHKDGILPWNGHAMRTHQPEYLLLLYYPQDTPEDLGPTEILPCTCV
jgi:hypothetical protein